MESVREVFGASQMADATALASRSEKKVGIIMMIQMHPSTRQSAAAISIPKEAPMS